VKPLKSDVPGGDAFGLKETLDPPRRLWPAFRENDGGSGWIWLHTVQALSRAALDTEEYSYGYLFGRSLGLEPENIWIAGDNGTRAEHSAVHAARVLQAARGELPSRVLILYTGNDLCAPTWELMTDTESYGEGLRRGIMFLARHGHTAGQQPTKVYVPAVLAITGLISENSILDKKIKFYGTEITCREARKRMFAAPDVVLGREEVSDPRYPFFAQLLPPNPALLCPTLFSRAAEEPAKLSIIANRIRAYREVQKSVVESINKEIAARPELARLDVQFIENTGRVLFQGEDVSGDCFHLSPRGQAKVAQSLVASIPK
ncbi:MAG: hypothetical protein NTV34_14065, partial [Proteobacteria bacterium]|nr:hypothetical protein [Pseudomonadota bacterium]